MRPAPTLEQLEDLLEPRHRPVDRLDDAKQQSGTWLSGGQRGEL